MVCFPNRTNRIFRQECLLTTQHYNSLSTPSTPNSCLMDDEPEQAIGFSRKMSLKGKTARSVLLQKTTYSVILEDRYHSHLLCSKAAFS